MDGRKLLTKEQRVAVVRCLVEGNSIRSTVRITGVSLNAIQKLTRELGEAVDLLPLNVPGKRGPWKKRRQRISD